MVGGDDFITRIGWEQNGKRTFYRHLPADDAAAGVGYWVLYGDDDVSDTFKCIAGLQKNVAPASLTDFNLNGNGPNGMIDQTNKPAINRCPMGKLTVNGTKLPVIDIISVDSGVGQWGVGHVAAWLTHAKNKNKGWAISECTGVEVSGDLVEDVDSLLKLANGVSVYDRGNNVYVTAFEAATYFSLFRRATMGQVRGCRTPGTQPRHKLGPTLSPWRSSGGSPVGACHLPWRGNGSDFRTEDDHVYRMKARQATGRYCYRVRGLPRVLDCE